MTERKGIYIKPDYFSIVFDNLTGIDVIQNILEMPMMVFYQKDGYVEHKRYTKVYQFDHIRIYFHPPKTVENPNQIGAYLVITGQGCDFLVAYLQQLGKDFRTFLERCRFLCVLNYFRITRLDIAIDDKNEPPYFTPKQVKRKCKRGVL